jgi:UDP-N-acetylmuramoylalanine--D-glutamate ligase
MILKKKWANLPPTIIILQMNEYIKSLKTPIAIVGMGRSGDAAKKLLKKAGIAASDILTFDGKLSTADFNDPAQLMAEAKPQTLVVSPGVPLASPWIQDAKKNKVHITSEISLACSFLTTERLIGITGSVGKSTTVSLLGAGLAAFSPTSFVGGNLGIPFAEYAVGLLEGSHPLAEWVVLELSSYQLENSAGLELEYSAITYFTSNHLERYESLDHYYETKCKILSLTEKVLFLNKEGGELVDYFQKKMSTAKEKVQIVSRNDEILKPLHLAAASLIGKHNQDNLALSSTLALAAGWPRSAIEGLKKFKGLSHRLENLGVFNGVRFIKDSKATAMDSVLIAVSAAHDTLSSGGKLFVLLGGRDKNLPWQDLKEFENLKGVEYVFFGECREIAKSKSQLPGVSFAKMPEALEYLRSAVKMQDTVLLSPGGTSLDEFKSFEDRGNVFKKWVAEYSTL